MLIYQSLLSEPATSNDIGGFGSSATTVVVLEYANRDSSTSNNTMAGAKHYKCLVDGVPKTLPYPKDPTGLGRIEMDAFNAFVKMKDTFGAVKGLSIDRMDTMLASSLNLKWPVWFNEGGRSLRSHAGSRRANSEKG